MLSMVVVSYFPLGLLRYRLMRREKFRTLQHCLLVRRSANLIIICVKPYSLLKNAFIINQVIIVWLNNF